MIWPRRVSALLLAVALAALALAAQAARVPDVGVGAIIAADAVASSSSSSSSSPAAAAAAASPNDNTDNRRKKKRKAKNPYSSPLGLFIQERASKMLPGPGQHFSFGALQPWEDVISLLEEKPASERKLLLLIRHGQAVSNFLGDALGPDEWFTVEGTCRYDPKNGTEPLEVFDADLTALGREQASALNSMLRGGGWWPRLTGGHAARAVVSPLTRCLNTASLALDGLQRGGQGGITATVVEEFVRETLGEDTCDARRSASDPPAPSAPSAARSASSLSSSSSDSSNKGGGAPQGPCPFDQGLRSKFPSYKFEVVGEGNEAGRGRARGVGRGGRGRDEDQGDDDDQGGGADPGPRPFGLVSDADTLWTKESREQQKHQVKRARAFLDILFAHAEERVAVVVTHSGFARSLLLAVEREPYRPMNAELVPVIVDRRVEEEGDDDE